MFADRKARILARAQQFVTRRNSVFSAVSALMEDRISLVGGIADRAAKVGLDVATARSDLAQASTLLATAKTDEPLAMTALVNGISSATTAADIMAAIQQVRGYQVPQTMLQARQAIRGAAIDLRQKIQAYQATHAQDATAPVSVGTSGS